MCYFCYADFYIDQERPVTFVHSVTEREVGLTTGFAFITFVTLVMGDMTVQKFLCYLLLSHQTACIFHLLLLLHSFFSLAHIAC